MELHVSKLQTSTSPVSFLCTLFRPQVPYRPLARNDYANSNTLQSSCVLRMEANPESSGNGTRETDRYQNQHDCGEDRNEEDVVDEGRELLHQNINGPAIVSVSDRTNTTQTFSQGKIVQGEMHSTECQGKGCEFDCAQTEAEGVKEVGGDSFLVSKCSVDGNGMLDLGVVQPSATGESMTNAPNPLAGTTGDTCNGSSNMKDSETRGQYEKSEDIGKADDEGRNLGTALQIAPTSQHDEADFVAGNHLTEVTGAMNAVGNHSESTEQRHDDEHLYGDGEKQSTGKLDVHRELEELEVQEKTDPEDEIEQPVDLNATGAREELEKQEVQDPEQKGEVNQPGVFSRNRSELVEGQEVNDHDHEQQWKDEVDHPEVAPGKMEGHEMNDHEPQQKGQVRWDLGEQDGKDEKQKQNNVNGANRNNGEKIDQVLGDEWLGSAEEERAPVRGLICTGENCPDSSSTSKHGDNSEGSHIKENFVLKPDGLSALQISNNQEVHVHVHVNQLGTLFTGDQVHHH